MPLHLKLPMISIWILLVLQNQHSNWKLILGLDSPFSVIFRLSDSEVDNANALWKLFVLLDYNFHSIDIERLFMIVPLSNHMYQNNTQRCIMGGSSVILGLLSYIMLKNLQREGKYAYIVLFIVVVDTFELRKLLMIQITSVCVWCLNVWLCGGDSGKV